MFTTLGFPFFTFHDRDVVPEGDSLKEFGRNLAEMTDLFAKKMQKTGVKLLWGTANLFSHPRYLAGAATNPDPDVFAYAAAQVKNVIDATHKLGGANYVLWGGREGYETLLNTDLRREQEQLGRFLSLVVEYKHKIGFKGVILVEPKPQEPTKHQYDFDVATVFGFLQRFGLEQEVKLNIEVGHAVLAHHSFEHEIALATALGMLGSIDANRNDYQSGWDTDQFPNNAAELVPALYFILKSGGLAPGGFNFDAKVRRQSIDPADLLLGHIGGIDVCAAALVAAAQHDRGRQVRRAARRALRRLGEARGEGDAGEGRDARSRSPRGSPRRRSSRSRSRAGRNTTRTCSTAISESRPERAMQEHRDGIARFAAAADRRACARDAGVSRRGAAGAGHRRPRHRDRARRLLAPAARRRSSHRSPELHAGRRRHRRAEDRVRAIERRQGG